MARPAICLKDLSDVQLRQWRRTVIANMFRSAGSVVPAAAACEAMPEQVQLSLTVVPQHGKINQLECTCRRSYPSEGVISMTTDQTRTSEWHSSCGHLL